ncbi:uncharacterized lipoprotein YddW (UPF0748 family) [Natranaerovirga pectinivora]|uniref:Uncharacterized lipoprotein YddW (UPF0748 family) n=1 Tax=Natranaerovirga pectinivora TaxID=682400 RepID=A0A4R3MQC3_9FIRM|nr:family 10 glycosylhydrolase [Natranaerovirga pectinivora]TCT15371.1 uncharacterized lipoprotein YddW (UPF0748 family) [Natranaerovirga pectinivora]
MEKGIILVRKMFLVMMSLVLFAINIEFTHSAEIGRYVNYAESLKNLGLFWGTNNGFELTRNSTRAEAAAMLVRLLGAESEAFSNIKAHPFKDVPQWADPYIGFLYNEGLTVGISDINYGSQQMISASEYTTFLLRALGYSDRDGDFYWKDSLEFAQSIHMVSVEEANSIKGLNGFTRDYMVKFSYNSLYTLGKDSNEFLIDSLYKKGAISNNTENEKREFNIDNEMRAVWISYLDLQPIFRSNGKDGFTQEVRMMYKNIKDLGLNTVIVQVRPFGDAIYPSSYFPWSHIITGEEGKDPGYDPLSILVKEAHNQGLKIEAWLNPYRLRSNKSALSNNNIGLKWLNDGSNRAIQIKEGIFFNPGSKDAQNLIVEGIKEIIKKYDVDGIHFDDYFYPSIDLSYDYNDFQEYLAAGGTLSQGEWRRENVNSLIRGVYKVIKEINPNISFGISPQNDIQKNYDQLYIDIEKWVNTPGYIDYIVPQIYFGFEHSKYPFEIEVKEWNHFMKNSNVRLYIGLSAYKIGIEDKWAGSAKLEWTTELEMLKRMVMMSRENINYDGFMIFRYDSLWKPGRGVREMVENERIALRTILTF